MSTFSHPKCSSLDNIPTESMNFDCHEHDLIGHECTIYKKMLIICHSYNNFQKDSIEAISGYFEEIEVLVRTNPFAEISNYLHIPQFERFKISYKIDLSHNPLNINIITTPLWYLPYDRSYKCLGKKHLNAVEKAIQNNQLNFDLIHTHFTWSSGYVGARLKEKYNVPFVVTAHGYDIYSLPFRDKEWQDKIEYVLKTANHIITVSQSNLACIKKLDVSTPVTVIPNGFRSDLFHFRNSFECRKKLNLPQDKKILLTVGNLEPVKGQKHLVEAVQKIVREIKDVLCIVIGAGKLQNDLKSQIRSLGLDHNIMIIGGKPHDEIPLWMNACDLFVLPSLNEGNPTVMFEALGCGKPFVGTKVGAIPEIIINDKLGILVEPRDPDGLAQAILQSLKTEWDEEYIREYAEQFTWDHIAKKIMNVYESVVKKM